MRRFEPKPRSCLDRRSKRRDPTPRSGARAHGSECSSETAVPPRAASLDPRATDNHRSGIRRKGSESCGITRKTWSARSKRPPYMERTARIPDTPPSPPRSPCGRMAAPESGPPGLAVSCPAQTAGAMDVSGGPASRGAASSRRRGGGLSHRRRPGPHGRPQRARGADTGPPQPGHRPERKGGVLPRKCAVMIPGRVEI